jgi:hypothetical protein
MGRAIAQSAYLFGIFQYASGYSPDKMQELD